MQPERVPSADVLIENTCSCTKIDPCFVPVIDAAVRAYAEALPQGILSLRLLGSVARGEAIVGQSDIDLMALVEAPPSASALQQLADRAARLQQTYPVVAQVDLGVTARQDIGAFQRLVLSSDSLHLQGVDTLTQPQQRMERAALVALVTPDAATLIADYRTAVESLTEGRDDALRRRFSRVTGKDLLKCLRAIALQRGGPYEKSIARIHAQLQFYAPEQQPLAASLFALYRTPAPDKERVLAALAAADKQLLSSPR